MMLFAIFKAFTEGFYLFCFLCFFCIGSQKNTDSQCFNGSPPWSLNRKRQQLQQTQQNIMHWKPVKTSRHDWAKRQGITPSYHRVTHDEDGQVRVAGFHQVYVLQGVSHVNLEILDVHPFSFTLTMANWRWETESCCCSIIFTIGVFADRRRCLKPQTGKHVLFV